MGGAKYSLKKGIQFVQERKQFGKAIGEFSASKEKIAYMASRVYAAESVQYRTANLIDESLHGLYDSQDHKLIGKRMSEYATECAICKVFGSETLDYVADETLQLYGGAGFIKDYGIEQIYRDSRINRIFEGSNEINRLLIPTHLFRKAMKGEINLKVRVEEAMLELQNTSSPTEAEFNKEREAVDLLRNVFLLSAGLAYEAYGETLVNEQETLMRLADLAIYLFAAESTVYRTYKSILKNGEKATELKMNLTRTYLEQTVFEVERISRSLVSQLTSGEMNQQLTRLLFRECSKYSSFGQSFERNREIAEKLYDANQFVC